MASAVYWGANAYIPDYLDQTGRHELITPMNGVCGSLDLVADSELTDDQRLYVDQARQCAADLLRLLRQILAFNRADAGLLGAAAAEFSPAELLESVATEHADAASAKRLSLHTRCGVVASARSAAA